MFDLLVTLFASVALSVSVGVCLHVPESSQDGASLHDFSEEG